MDGGASIGQAFRSRREERGLSLEQAAFQSRVPLRLVQTLESDDYRLVPDAFYMIRVLHDYARFLGLDAGAMERSFLAAIQGSARPAPPPSPAAPAAPSVSWRHVAWTAAAVLAVVPLVFIALSLSARQASPPPAPPPAREVPVSAPDAKLPPPSELPAVVATAGSSAQPAAAPPAVEPPPVTDQRPASETGAAVSVVREPATEGKPRRLLLLAEAMEPTWMAVRADGAERRQVLLRAGEKVRFGADAGFVVTLGNAGGVQLSLNGERLPMLGKSGEVVRDLALPRRDAAGDVPSAEAR